MSFLTYQEKGLTIFLLGTTLLGSIIGIFRHNWVSNPEILSSPDKLPEFVQLNHESNIIQTHNKLAKNKNITNSQREIESVTATHANTIVAQPNQVIDDKQLINKTNKKNTTQNSPSIININIASKEDFMALPYIGEVKAGRLIQLRNEIGNFKSVNDLEKVKGIGAKTLVKIKPYLTI